MTKYHINQMTGNVNICRAEKEECPLKDAEGGKVPHFDSKEDAVSFIEQDLNNEYGSTKTVGKGVRKLSNTKVPQNFNYEVLEKYYINPHDADYEYEYIYGEDGSERIDEDSVLLNSVDVEKIAKNIAGKKGDWQKVQQILSEHGADNPENYSIEVYEWGNSTEVIIDFKNKQAAVEDLKKHSEDK